MRIKSLSSGIQKLFFTTKYTSPYFYAVRCNHQSVDQAFVELPKPLSHKVKGQACYVENFRCNESNPENHTLKDLGLFYKLPDDLLNKVVTEKWNTFMYSNQFLRHTKAFNEHCQMIRRPGLELVHYLKHANYDLPVNRYLLYGPTGAGKSMTLQYAIQYAMSQNWLVVPCLNTWDWTHFHYTGKEEKRQEVTKSSFEENRYDQPEKAADWLRTFHLVNHKLLSTLHTTKTYVWTQRDETPAGSTFLQLVEVGLARMRYAPDIIGALVKEILLQDSKNFPKTLLAVDCVNVFFHQPQYLKMMYGFIPQASELSYFHNVRKMMQNTWNNGAVVAAISTFNGQIPTDIEEHPYDSLTSEGFNCLDPHVPIRVPNYTDKEVLSQLAYYIERKWLTGKALTQAGEAELIQISDHNPRDLVELCTYVS